MKRELFIHFSFWFSFFVFISIIKHVLTLSYWPFWLGGIVGIFLPDIDHLLYMYLTGPQELTSRRINYLIGNKDFIRTIGLLYETRNERNNLIFHTIFFQIIFLILTFWVMTSSGSLIGRGLVLSFALHLSVDQIVDLTEMKSFDNWTKMSPLNLTFEKSKIYWIVGAIITVFLGLLI